MIWSNLKERAAEHGLMLMGVAQADDDVHKGPLALLGTDRGFWDIFVQSDEYRDGQPDPVDRWSKRIIGALADEFGTGCTFPSDGPPYPPVIRWALDTGRFHQSPVGMMIHDQAGLMISIRGILLFPGNVAFEPTNNPSPCVSCVEKPCLTACPIGALSDVTAYDVPACKSHIATSAGQTCMTGGCLVRRACPVSQKHSRVAAQSEFHMKAFLRA